MYTIWALPVRADALVPVTLHHPLDWTSLDAVQLAATGYAVGSGDSLYRVEVRDEADRVRFSLARYYDGSWCFLLYAVVTG